MKFKIIIFFLLGFILFNSLTYTHAQKRTVDGAGNETPDTTRPKDNQDSAKAARSFIADSMKAARAYALDSAKAARKYAADSAKDARAHLADSTAHARKAKSDSLQTARKRVADSSAAVRKYRDSKHYKDSVTRSRTGKANGVKTSRQAHLDSMQNARKHSTDSLSAFRKARTDSVKAVQKARSDSLAKIKKYKTSKRYADSVSIAKHDRLDSLHNRQKATRDSIATVRKHSLDSAKTVRKHVMDSTKTVRTKYMDSVKIVRKARADSFAKIKANKEKLAKAKEKKKEEANKFKLELKMKQKHEAWSNKSMLKKKWTPQRRLLQNSFTHYNYYFNANKKMEEAMLNMQRSRKENYDSIIGLYPFDPNRDSSLLSADMDSIIRKVSVGIQIHDPRVKWSNDMYLLLGEAYYYRGKYEEASIAFRYIISTDEEAKKKKMAKNGSSSSGSKSKEAPSIVEDEPSRLAFLKHKSVHNESILWLSRTYTEAHQVENSESVLSLLEADSKLPADLKGRVAVEKAFAYLTDNNQLEASKQLAIAVDDPNLPDWLRMRASFINGQLLQNMGEHKQAANSFEKTLTYYPKLEMDFYSRKYIAFNKLQGGEDVAEAMKPLKKVLNDGKYVSYYDQVYYVLGKLAVKANKPDEAITYFNKSIKTPKATKKQKALSFAALGDVYYSTTRYASAKMAYDSSAKYSGSSSKDANVAAVAQRSKVLADISGPMTVIHDQDSLLELSHMSKKAQEAVVRRAIGYLEKKRNDSIANVQNAGANSVAQAEAEGENQDQSGWYFGNSSLMQQGSADFKRKWGNRALTDNWRRNSGVPLASTSGSQEDNEVPEEVIPVEKGLPTEASLAARIPNTPKQKEQAVKLEEKAYIQLAKAYVKQLEDYAKATSALDTLDKRFPDHSQKEEELYLRYQIAIRQNKLDKAQAYSQELLNKFPNSQYASVLRPKQSEGKADMANTQKVNEYFDETYKLILQHQYTEALMRINIARKQYDDPVYKKRFTVAEAMSYAGTGDFNQADTVISGFLRANPADTLTSWASTVQNYIKEVRNGGQPSWLKDWHPVDSTMLAAKAKAARPRAPKPVVPPPPSDIPSAYVYDAKAEHYCIVVLPGLDSRTAQLKRGIKSFDDAKYGSVNLELLLDLFDIDQSVLLVKKFANEEQAKSYMSGLVTSDALYMQYKEAELKTFIISAVNYKKMLDDKDAKPYFSFYGSNYK